MDIKDQSIESNDFLDLFEGVDEAPDLIKPMTNGLGFKDRVSEGVYTMEVDHGHGVSSDCGTLDIGGRDAGDGILDVSASGNISIKAALGAQPVIFHSGHDGLIKKSAKKSGESIFGAFVDVLLVFSTTIFLVAFAAEFTSYTFRPEGIITLDPAELRKLFVIFAALFLTYKIGARVFYGRTLGEWSSRHQLGLLNQQHRFYYPIQVFFREVICLGTGVFTLPFLSLILGRDVGFYFSGLQTYIEQKKK
jgi:hypothetical protein